MIETVEEEIKMMARLNHPHVVRILGATRQGCHFFMFVEWMPGTYNIDSLITGSKCTGCQHYSTTFWLLSYFKLIENLLNML